jgi:hypothetical protein
LVIIYLDPYILQGWNIPSHWTSGNYVFEVKTLFNNKGGIGTEDVKRFALSPDQLFDLQYNLYPHPLVPFTLYILAGIQNKTVNLNQLLFNWDLNQYASTIKISIEEVDNTVIQSQKIIDNVKYATNFGVDTGFNIGIVKIGLKFGASLEETRQKENFITWTDGNDVLGSVIINFADKVIIDQFPDPYYLWGTIYRTREYDNTMFAISVEPKRVQ